LPQKYRVSRIATMKRARRWRRMTFFMALNRAKPTASNHNS
jgi:hypothetical protein